MKPLTINGRDVTRGMKLSVRISRTWLIRMHLGCCLIRFAGWIIGVQTEVELSKGDIA